MIKFMLCAAACLAFINLGQPTAHAHQVVSNQKVTALVHVTPDDNPAAGAEEVSQISFELNGVVLSSDSHELSMAITRPNGTIETDYIYAWADGQVVSTSYRFEELGSYTLALTGKARSANQTDFSINYQQEIVRTAKTATTDTGSPTQATGNSNYLLPLLLVIALVTTVVGTIVIIRKSR